ncbi:MAG: ArgE/DapE family deacylase [Acidobacteriota bacterium]
MLTALEADVLNAVDVNRLVDDLRALIRMPSLGGQEGPAQEWMARRLRRRGLEVDEWTFDVEALSAHPAFSMEVPRTTAVGVVGSYGGGDGPTLVLNGHIDVVPVGDRDQWSVDPFAGVARQGAVVGRGACDMKGGLAAGLAVLDACIDRGVRLRGRVMLQSVVGEEDGGIGTLAAIVRGHRGDGAICMEPTTLSLAPAHAGALSFRVRVPGRAAHGCVREEGVSALETFRPVHDALLALEAERNSRLRLPMFERYRLPYALSIGRVTAGDWPSSVPDALICEGRYGMAPGEQVGEAMREFEQAVQRAAAGHPFLRDHPPAIEWWGGQFLPARTSEDAAIVRVTQSAMAEVMAGPPRVEAMTYGADMRLLVNEADVPTVLFGAGDVRHAHRADEFVLIEDLATAARVMALAALRFAG